MYDNFTNNQEAINPNLVYIVPAGEVSIHKKNRIIDQRDYNPYDNFETSPDQIKKSMNNQMVNPPYQNGQPPPPPLSHQQRQQTQQQNHSLSQHPQNQHQSRSIPNKIQPFTVLQPALIPPQQQQQQLDVQKQSWQEQQRQQQVHQYQSNELPTQQGQFDNQQRGNAQPHRAQNFASKETIPSSQEKQQQQQSNLGQPQSKNQNGNTQEEEVERVKRAHAHGQSHVLPGETLIGFQQEQPNQNGILQQQEYAQKLFELFKCYDFDQNSMISDLQCHSVLKRQGLFNAATNTVVDEEFDEEVFQQLKEQLANAITYSVQDFVEVFVQAIMLVDEKQQDEEKQLQLVKEKLNELMGLCEQAKKKEQETALNQRGYSPQTSKLYVDIDCAKGLEVPSIYQVRLKYDNDRKVETTCQQVSQLPAFNASFQLDVRDEKSSLEFEIWDLKRNQIVGLVTHKLRSFFHQKKINEWYILENQGGALGDIHRQIAIAIQWVYSERQLYENILRENDYFEPVIAESEERIVETRQIALMLHEVVSRDLDAIRNSKEDKVKRAKKKNNKQDQQEPPGCWDKLFTWDNYNCCADEANSNSNGNAPHEKQQQDNQLQQQQEQQKHQEREPQLQKVNQHEYKNIGDQIEKIEENRGSIGPLDRFVDYFNENPTENVAYATEEIHLIILATIFGLAVIIGLFKPNFVDVCLTMFGFALGVKRQLNDKNAKNLQILLAVSVCFDLVSTLLSVQSWYLSAIESMILLIVQIFSLLFKAIYMGFLFRFRSRVPQTNSP